MDNPLDSKVMAQVDALCRKISVAEDIDPQIREELRGHMEDKLRAYMAGEETLTEDDALILVKEHFGDPAVLKALLQEVHAQEAAVSLGRRLAAVAVVTLAVDVLVKVLLLGVAVACWVAFPKGLPPAAGLSSFFIMILAPLAMIGVLVPWRRQLTANEDPWFVRCASGTLTRVFLLLFGFSILVPLCPMAIHWESAGISLGFLRFFFVFPALSYAASCLVWLWWCDIPPRTNRVITTAFLVWLALKVGATLFPQAMLSLAWGDETTTMTLFAAQQSIWSGSLSVDGLTGEFTAQLPTFQSFASIGISLVYLLLTGYVGRIAYAVAGAMRWRRSARALGSRSL